MRRARAGLLLAALACASPLVLASPAAAQVSVRFLAPGRYTDAGNRPGASPNLRVTLAEIRRLFTGLGARVLGPGETLSIEVLDIDLAGFDQPGANVPYGLRVVTDSTPPRIRLRYALRRNGRVAASGEDTLGRLDFLTRSASVANSATFQYEREAIRDWLQARIAGR